MPTAGDGARGWETKAIGSTSSALISTDAACMIRSTLRTKRKPVALRRRIPSIPARHPDLIRTRSPTFKKGWGSALRVDKTALSASISSVGNATGEPPKPIRFTRLGTCRTRNCSCSRMRTKRYLHFNPAAIAPLVKRAIVREEALDFAKHRLLENLFLVARVSVDGVPLELIHCSYRSSVLPFLRQRVTCSTRLLGRNAHSFAASIRLALFNKTDQRLTCGSQLEDPKKEGRLAQLARRERGTPASRSHFNSEGAQLCWHG